MSRRGRGEGGKKDKWQKSVTYYLNLISTTEGYTKLGTVVSNLFTMHVSTILALLSIKSQIKDIKNVFKTRIQGLML